MKIVRGRADGATSQARTDTFSGTVWGDPVLPTTDGVTINSVFFAPGGRTHWHRHEHGQVLLVTAGRVLAQVRGESVQVATAGDTIWIPEGEVHWHGAGDDAYAIHYAVSIGTTEWLDPVEDDDYQAAVDDGGQA